MPSSWNECAIQPQLDSSVGGGGRERLVLDVLDNEGEDGGVDLVLEALALARAQLGARLVGPLGPRRVDGGLGPARVLLEHRVDSRRARQAELALQGLDALEPAAVRGASVGHAELLSPRLVRSAVHQAQQQRLGHLVGSRVKLDGVGDPVVGSDGGKPVGTVGAVVFQSDQVGGRAEAKRVELGGDGRERVLEVKVVEELVSEEEA